MISSNQTKMGLKEFDSFLKLNFQFVRSNQTKMGLKGYVIQPCSGKYHGFKSDQNGIESNYYIVYALPLCASSNQTKMGLKVLLYCESCARLYYDRFKSDQNGIESLKSIVMLSKKSLSGSNQTKMGLKDNRSERKASDPESV